MGKVKFFFSLRKYVFAYTSFHEKNSHYPCLIHIARLGWLLFRGVHLPVTTLDTS